MFSYARAMIRGDRGGTPRRRMDERAPLEGDDALDEGLRLISHGLGQTLAWFSAAEP